MTPNCFATTGTVVRHIGTSPGPASGITYDIIVNMENDTTQPVPGVTNLNTRLPDAIKTIAAPPGKGCLVYIVGGQYQVFVFGETFEYEEACNDNP